MRLVIDACVLYPTVMREVVLGVAKQGLFTPLWSQRILDEWAHAAARLGPEGAAIAKGEIALLPLDFPEAKTSYDKALEQSLYLPDPADCHVLAAAITARADGILTLNAKDFPHDILATYGLVRHAPDPLLRGFLERHPDPVRQVAEQVHLTAQSLSGTAQDLRKLMKKTRLPRLGKALS